jgi:DNA-binding NarL/FixJ family response regulator
VPTSVVVVDDSEAYRRSAVQLLAMDGRFEIAGEASSGEEALELLDRLHPKVVLMDVNMPGMDGITTTRLIVDRFPDVGVVLISSVQLAELPIEAAQCGALGYLRKDDLDSAQLNTILNGDTGDSA